MKDDIYINPKISKKGGWTSFESNPHLKKTRKSIHQRCLPCIKNLHEQLIEGKQRIHLGKAYDCWKVVVVLESSEECLNVLEAYRDQFLPARYIRGRYGSKDGSGTQAIVISAESEAERDLFMNEMGSCLFTLGLKRDLFFSKGCADPYETLLGPWKTWQRHTPIRFKDNLKMVIHQLERLLR
jgi:hypothetical protein